MHQKLMTIMLLALLAGCAQPGGEQPRAKGAYLVIDGDQAWTVLVDGAERHEERGKVLDVLHFAEQQSVVAGYLIETPSCGRVQWLSQRRDGEQGLGAQLTALPGAMPRPSGCLISKSQGWTALDYSG